MKKPAAKKTPAKKSGTKAKKPVVRGKRISLALVKRNARAVFEKARRRLKRQRVKVAKEAAAAYRTPLQRIIDSVIEREARKEAEAAAEAEAGPSDRLTKKPVEKVYYPSTDYIPPDEPLVVFDAEGRPYLAPLEWMTELGDGDME